MNCILVSKPIGTLDSIVHMPPPIVLVHIPQSSIDSSLGCYRVTSSGEELGYARGVETSLGKTKGCPQTGTASTNDNGIILVILLPGQKGLHIYCP
jgi:hypothetical protein